MDRVGVPPEFPWWPESDQIRPRIPTEASGGRQGPPPLLRDCVRGKEHPITADDGSGALWSGPLVDIEGNVEVRRPKRYHLLTDDVLRDPFELNTCSNKLVNFGEESLPRLFPAFTTQPPPPGCHTHLSQL